MGLGRTSVSGLGMEMRRGDLAKGRGKKNPDSAPQGGKVDKPLEDGEQKTAEEGGPALGGEGPGKRALPAQAEKGELNRRTKNRGPCLGERGPRCRHYRLAFPEGTVMGSETKGGGKKECLILAEGGGGNQCHNRREICAGS